MMFRRCAENDRVKHQQKCFDNVSAQPRLDDECRDLTPATTREMRELKGFFFQAKFHTDLLIRPSGHKSGQVARYLTTRTT